MAAETESPDVPRPTSGPSPAGRATRRWSWVAVLVLVAVVSAVHAQWIISERANQVVEIDESAYLFEAVSATQRVTSHDLGSVRALYFEEGSQNAPLLSAATVPFLVVGSIGVRSALMVQITILAGLVLATFLLARRLAGDPWSVLAAGIVAVAPGFVDYTRTYHFALLTAAAMTAAVWCLLTTERFTRPWPSLGWGLLVGLALLSRTMMVSLVPGLVLAGLVAALCSGPQTWRRSVAWWGAGSALAVAVALPWWAANWDVISTYLTGYGYGGEGSAYGPLYSPAEPAYYLRIPYRVAQELYLPLALLVLAGVAAAAVQAVGVARRRGLAAFVRRGVDTGHVLVVIVVGSGMVALMSSRNKGTGFTLPLVPLIVVLAVVGLSRLPLASVRRVAVGAVVVVLLAGVVMKSDADTTLATTRGHHLILDEGPIPITDGRSHFEQFVASSRYPDGFDVSGVADETIDWMTEHTRSPEFTVAAAADGDLLFTPGYLSLLTRIRQDPLQVRFVTPRDDGSVDSYREQLAELSDPTPVEFVVTVDLDPFPASLSGAVDVARLEEAATDLGFAVEHEIPLVDGRTIRIWQRDLDQGDLDQ